MGSGIQGGFSRFSAWLQRPVDAASVATLRIAFGSIMLWEVFRYWGTIESYYVKPAYNFSYEGFSFVVPWPGDGMYWHFGITGLASACVALGLWYRAAAVIACLGYAYWFLLEQAAYLNHFYLVVLMSALLISMNAERWASLDAWRASRSGRPLPTTLPFWNLALLRAQLVIVYFFGGIAKITPDWLAGQPIGRWLERRTELPVLGPLFEHEWVRYHVFAHGGLLFDLLIGPLLLWKRTRSWALLPFVAFHLTNAHVFTIGIFPWLMIACAVIFFEPELPRRVVHRVWSWISRLGARLPGTVATIRAESPTLGSPSRVMPRPSPVAARAATGFVVAWLAVQVLVPLRHFVYLDNVVHWTEEGHRFAWHMKLRDKDGWVKFELRDPATGEIWYRDGRDVLTDRQLQKMSTRPHLIHQFAQYLGGEERNKGTFGVEVRAFSWASLNGRPHQPLVDSTVDLLAVDYPLFTQASWILPLDPSLPMGLYERLDTRKLERALREAAKRRE